MSRRKWIAGIGLGALVLVLLAPIAQRFRLEETYRDVVRRAKAQGVPLDLAGLEAAFPFPPDGENAGPLYAEARYIIGQYGEESLLRSRHTPLASSRLEPGGSSNDIALGPLSFYASFARAVIEQNAEAIDVLLRAPEFDRVRTDDEYSIAELQLTGSNQNVPTTEMAEVMAMYGAIAIEDGAMDDGVAALSSLCAMCVHAARKPGLSSWANFSHIGNVATALSDVLLDKGTLTGPQAAKVHEALITLADPQLLRGTLYTDLTLSCTSFEENPPTPGLQQGRRYDLFQRLTVGFANAEAGEGQRIAQAHVARIGGRINVARSLDGTLRDAYLAIRQLQRDELVFPEFMLRSRVTYSLTPQQYEFAVGTMSDALCHATAAAVQEYQAETGALPAALTDLVPNYLDAVPQNPYTGEPLGYEVRSESDYVVFADWAAGHTPELPNNNYRIEAIVERPAGAEVSP